MPPVSSYTGDDSLPEIAAPSGILQVAHSIDKECAKAVSRPVVLTLGAFSRTEAGGLLPGNLNWSGVWAGYEDF